MGPRPSPPRIWARRGCCAVWIATAALLRHLHHVIDSLLDEVVGCVGAAALGRHQTRATLKALEGVLVERRLALGDARSPGGLVAGLGCAADSLSVAGGAGLIEELGTVLRHGGHGRAARPRCL